MTSINLPKETKVRCTLVEGERDGGGIVRGEERGDHQQTLRGGGLMNLDRSE